jgi:3-hydroxyisobutyrate dehydrogenase-like beta-hydroxyacid dehydrogenase
LRVCLFGLGEAGSAFADDLVRLGVSVSGYDPRPVGTPFGVTRCDRPTDAVQGAEFVMAFTAAADAASALTQAIDVMPRTVVYVDFSTGTADLKTKLSEVASAHMIQFVDVALMAPVPGKGVHTPALACGPGARRFVDAFRPLGMSVEYDGDRAGRSATRKLLRSIVMKGLAALVIESMNAAHVAGLGDETWQNIVEQLTLADEAFVRRLVDGTGPHAVRRLHEMQAAAQLIAELGLSPTMTDGTVASLQTFVDGQPLPVLPVVAERTCVDQTEIRSSLQ